MSLKNQQRVILATGNPGKAREFIQLLAPTGWDVVALDTQRYTLPEEAQGPTATLEGNASLKATHIIQQLKNCRDWVLADDSGLFVHALGGKPGVDTAHFGGYKRLLELMEAVPIGRRSAEFRCVLALARPGYPPLLAHGVDAGTIALTPCGNNRFGFDPVFIPDGFTETFAQLKASGGLPFSHRGLAVTHLLQQLGMVTL